MAAAAPPSEVQENTPLGQARKVLGFLDFQVKIQGAHLDKSRLPCFPATWSLVWAWHLRQTRLLLDQTAP